VLRGVYVGAPYPVPEKLGAGGTCAAPTPKERKMPASGPIPRYAADPVGTGRGRRDKFRPFAAPSVLGVNRVNVSYREGGESALTEEEDEW
jgi:hypothetical protein